MCLVVEASPLADALLRTYNELLGNLKAVRGIRGLHGEGCSEQSVLRQHGLRDLRIIQGFWNVQDRWESHSTQ